MGVLLRRAHEEGMVDPGAALGPLKLVGQIGFAQRGRAGVGHLKDRSNPAQGRRAGAAFQIFLVLEPGLPEMHLAVDDARQHGQAGDVQHLGRIARYMAERRDAPVLDRDIDILKPIGGRNAPAAQDQVVGFSQAALLMPVTRQL